MAKKSAESKEPKKPVEPEADVENGTETGDVTETEAVPPEPSCEELLEVEREKFLRLAAEFDNYRRRSQKERETVYSEVKAETAARFLPVYDNILRAHSETENNEDKSEFFQVADMMKRQIEGVFDSVGIELISNESERGKTFDPERHNAIIRTPADGDTPENTVSIVISSGCAINGKTYKHADVAIFQNI